MTLGAILVIVGVILAVIDLFTGNRRYGPAGGYGGTLLHVAVILIGVGVLVGGAQIDTN